VKHIAVDDRITTNICFGGPDFQTAYITASSTGRLLAMKWPYKGLKLNNQ
jgi:gluconolactonase